MSEMKRRPILGHGEYLVEPFNKKGGFSDKVFPRTYDEAAKLVKGELINLTKEIDNIQDSKRMEEIIVAVRLNKKFLAKSYSPDTFFRELNAKNVGSRSWITEDGDESKINFVKIKPKNIENGIKLIDRSNKQNFKEDIQKIEKINLLSVQEIISGFEKGWKSGRVELVIHPFEEVDSVLEKLFDILKLDENIKKNVKYKAYENGPIFVSLNLNKNDIDLIKDFNPLRTVHPLNFEMKSIFDEAIVNRVSLPEVQAYPTKRVGLIDGGVDMRNSFFSQYVNQNYEIESPVSDFFIEHGSKVASVILYGDISNKSEGEQLDAPIVGIESIRVFPTMDASDIDLYEVIDKIEEVVPRLENIDIFNISVGPSGIITDDAISRFTTALDILAYKYKKLFIVAVGNNGGKNAPFNRIESPSDMVNGIGVGAYQKNRDGSISRAPYSCVGAGREGCKIKPDISEHGGSELNPILVLGPSDYCMYNVQGTSFAAPLVARKAAELMIQSTDIGILAARSLLTHSASLEVEDIDYELGYGACVNDVNDILMCTQNKVTILYNNEMSVKQYAKINIPLPTNSTAKKYKITWTVVVETPPNPLYTESYTATTIEDTLHPHIDRYKFTSPNTKQTATKNIETEREDVNILLNEGWTQSYNPVTMSPQKFKTESERRNDLKWDTVFKRSKVFNNTSLKKPFLSFHALDRYTNTSRIRYSVAITIEAINYNGDLYSDILSEYPVLTPINIRQENEIRTNIQND